MFEPSVKSRHLAARAMRLVHEMDKTGVLAILLVGSVARGMAEWNSDLDIMIVCGDALSPTLMNPVGPFGFVNLSGGTFLGTASLRDTNAECFLIQEQAIQNIFKLEFIEKTPDFIALEMLAQSVPLWVDENFSYCQDMIRQVRKRLRLGPVELTDYGYETFKQEIQKGVSRNETEFVLQSLDRNLFKAVGFWPYPIAEREHRSAKHNKRQLPPELYEIVVEIGRIKAEVYDRDEGIDLELQQDIKKLAQQTIAYIDRWRPNPGMCNYMPRRNPLTAKDFGL